MTYLDRVSILEPLLVEEKPLGSSWGWRAERLKQGPAPLGTGSQAIEKRSPCHGMSIIPLGTFIHLLSSGVISLASILSYCHGVVDLAGCKEAWLDGLY